MPNFWLREKCAKPHSFIKIFFYKKTIKLRNFQFGPSEASDIIGSCKKKLTVSDTKPDFKIGIKNFKFAYLTTTKCGLAHWSLQLLKYWFSLSTVILSHELSLLYHVPMHIAYIYLSRSRNSKQYIRYHVS